MKTENCCHDREKAKETPKLFLRKAGIVFTNSLNSFSSVSSVNATPERTAVFSVSRSNASDATNDMSYSSSQQQRKSSPQARSSFARRCSKQSIMYLKKTMLVCATRES